MERGERLELFGDHDRGVVGQQDAAGADAEVLGGVGEVADEDGGGGAGDAAHAVMLRHPISVIAQRVSQYREIHCVPQRLPRCGPLHDRGGVQH